MPRLLLSDEHCSKLEKILLQQAIYNRRHLRLTVEGMRAPLATRVKRQQTLI